MVKHFDEANVILQVDGFWQILDGVIFMANFVVENANDPRPGNVRSQLRPHSRSHDHL